MSLLMEALGADNLMVFRGLTGNMYIVSRDRESGESVLEYIKKAKSSLVMHDYEPIFVARIKSGHTKLRLLGYINRYSVKYRREKV